MITAGSLESGVEPAVPFYLLTKALSSNVSSAAKDGFSPDCTSVCILMHLHKLTCMCREKEREHQWGCTKTQLEQIS